MIDEYVQRQAENPPPRKINDGRTIYLSGNNFGPLKSLRQIPKIVDLGLAQRGDGQEPQRHPIQPFPLIAPEVLLGTSWSYKADIWNLGVLVCYQI